MVDINCSLRCQFLGVVALWITRVEKTSVHSGLVDHTGGETFSVHSRAPRVHLLLDRYRRTAVPNLDMYVLF